MPFLFAFSDLLFELNRHFGVVLRGQPLCIIAVSRNGRVGRDSAVLDLAEKFFVR